MERYIIFGITADICCLLLSAVAILVVTLWGHVLAQAKLVKYVFLAHAAQLLANLLGLVYKGGTAPYVHTVLRVTNFCEFASGYVLAYLLMLYLLRRVERGNDMLRFRRLAAAICAGAVLMLIVSQFTGLYYTIDEANYYHRSAGYPISLLFAVVPFSVIGVVTVRYRDRLDRLERMAIWSYIILPIAATIAQAFIYGIYIILLTNTMALVIMFLMMNLAQTRAFYEKERQLADMRVNLMLSQIQPHFLYNALGAIEQLCTVDPQGAKRATHEFSAFLRGNLDSLSADKTISFEQELTHTKSYLAIEKLRFQQYLNIEYHIETTLFRLPTLTLQPIVENAVRYGVTKKEEGGTVTITTKETDAAFLVIVEDDGVGFDPAVPKEDGKTHLGIQNVRDRLACMVNGTLEIQSTPVIGTVATITIPKGDD